MHKVLVTDYAWKSLDIERKILGAIGAELLVAESGEEQDLMQLAPEVDAILTCWKPVPRPVIERAIRCVMIGRYGVGLDNIDLSAATEHGIVVTNVPDYCVEEVSDHTLALLFACARKVAAYDRAIKGGTYDMRAMMPMFRLAGKTLGIAGAGRHWIRPCPQSGSLGLASHCLRHPAATGWQQSRAGRHIRGIVIPQRFPFRPCAAQREDAPSSSIATHCAK